MIICTNCQHEEIIGAIFCSECGNQLVSSNQVTQGIATGGMAGVKGVTSQPKRSVPLTLNAWATIHFLDSGRFVPLTDRAEYTLGRSSEGQPIMPDLDLTEHGAYESGVSRLHAVIKNAESRILLMDLGSSNGTFINGNRLEPNVARVLSHGDIISLGKLKLQILLV